MTPALLLTVLLLAPLPTHPPEAPRTDTLRVDLTEAVRMALAGSPEVAVEEAGVRFAEARLAQARAARLLPTAQLTTGHALAPPLDVPDDTPFGRDALYLDPRVREDWSRPRPYSEFTLEFLQPLLTWGELDGQVRAAAAAVEVERAEADGRAREVALRTAELVVGLAAAEALERLAAEAADLLETARTELTARLDEGDPDVSDADLFQLRLFEQELRRRAVEVREQRALAASALARQLGRPGTPVAVPPLEPLAYRPPPLEALQALALTRRPELRQAAAGEEARRHLVRVARSDLYPKLFAGASFSGRYTTGRERQPNPYIIDPYLGGGVRAGVGLRQQLAFGQTRARVAQAEAQLQEVRHQRTAAEQLVLFEVERAWRELTIAEAARAARQEAAAVAAEWLRLEQINADLALGNVRDLVAAARADLEARLALTEATRAHLVAALRLLDAAGLLAEDALAGTLFVSP